MTKKNHPHSHLSHRLRRPHADSRELAGQLAPLEELLRPEPAKPANETDSPPLVAQENGAIVVGRNKLTLAEDVVDIGDRKQFFGLERVVLVIVILILAFIVFIAWQVSGMPIPGN